MVEELAEAIAFDCIASAELFVTEVLTEVEHMGAAKLEINPIPDQDDYSVETKVGSNKV